MDAKEVVDDEEVSIIKATEKAATEKAAAEKAATEKAKEQEEEEDKEEVQYAQRPIKKRGVNFAGFTILILKCFMYKNKSKIS